MKRLCVFVLCLWAGVAHADLPGLLTRIKPAVVAVGTFLPTRNPQFRFYGTGFAVGDGSVVATNAHVVSVPLESEALERWAIAIPLDGSRVEVRATDIAARDASHDVALLGLRGAPLPALRLDASGDLREGEELNFTGYPIGTVLGLFPVTHRALVSALSPIAIPHAQARSLESRDIRRLSDDTWPVIQLDATAYPGSSGSPLFNPVSGEVVGIINMVFVKGSREAALSQPSGITFAIPARHIAALLRQVKPR